MSRLNRAPLLLLFPLVFLLVLAVGPTPPVASADEDEKTEAAAEQPAEQIVEEVVVPPQVIIRSQKAPDYPPAALAARFEGVVVMELHVRIDGTVGEAKVVDCSHPNIGFEEAAIAATKKWRFEPALKDGEPIAYPATFRVNFRVGVGGQAFVSWGGAGTSPGDTTASKDPMLMNRGSAAADATRGPTK
jgi:TonB family protein